MLRCSRRALCVAATVLAASATASKRVRAQAALELVVARARQERSLELWLNSPPSDQTRRALFEAFQRRFDLKVQWKWVSLHSARSTSRLVAEASAGRVSADIIAASADSLTDLAGRGLLRRYDWENTFGPALAGIEEPVRRLMPELRGLGLSWFDVVYVIAWNVHFVREPDAPRRFQDFLDPKWRGRFAISVLAGAPFDVLSLELGEAATLELVRGLLANQPILKAGTPSVGSAITTGEAHLGISAYTTSERARRNGEPQAYRFFEDYLPVQPLFVSVPEMAPHPNLARLFLAWLVTEGAMLIEQLDVSARISASASALAKAIEQQAPGARIIEERSQADVEKTRAMATRLSAIFSGRDI